MIFSVFNNEYKQQVIELFADVFSASEGKDEGLIIKQLVSELITTTANSDLIGFVAVENQIVLGAVFFSRFQVELNKKVFILSPMAIATSQQQQGYGQQLIQFAIEHLKGLEVNWLVTYGDPNFYSKVGFQKISESHVQAPLVLSYPEGWLGLSLDGSELGGVRKSACVSALNKQKYW